MQGAAAPLTQAREHRKHGTDPLDAPHVVNGKLAVECRLGKHAALRPSQLPPPQLMSFRGRLASRDSAGHTASATQRRVAEPAVKHALNPTEYRSVFVYIATLAVHRVIGLRLRVIMCLCVSVCIVGEFLRDCACRLYGVWRVS